MDSKNIGQLLEKYWNCETSLEEEMQLREYFLREEVPAQWKEAADLFRYFEHQKTMKMTGQAISETVFEKPEEINPAGKGVRMVYNYGRIAAGLLVVVAATYFIRQEVRKSYPREVDTYSDPKLAFEETKKALMMISSGFGKAKKETTKINMFNEAEKRIEGKKVVDKKEKVNI